MDTYITKRNGKKEVFAVERHSNLYPIATPHI